MYTGTGGNTHRPGNLAARRRGQPSRPAKYKFAVYPDILERAGYLVGFTGKGWAPGEFAIGGRVRNPSGTSYNRNSFRENSSAFSPIDYAANFNEFINSRRPGQPFCFWVGFLEPHRPYRSGAGLASGINAKTMVYPSFYPDAPEIRNDMLDYLYEIQYADNQIGRILQFLKNSGELDNTIIVFTGDNGMPFPRAKGTLYDYGVRVPLVLRWGNKCKGGMVVDDFVSLTDLAPTFLEAAGLPVPADMTGKSLINIIGSQQSGRIEASRDRVFTGRERHALCRPDEDENDPGYPSRAVRTHQYLYIRNYAPYRWPHGEAGFQSPQGFIFADTDAGPSASYLIQNRERPDVKPYFELCFGKRPGEELYDVVNDPDQIRNLALDARYESVKKELKSSLEAYQTQTGDPRAWGKSPWDYYPYFAQNPLGLVPFRKSLSNQVGGVYITHGGLLGEPGINTMRIWVRTSAPGSFYVKYGLGRENLNLGLSRAFTLAENDNTGWVTIEGLQPGTCYFYQLATDSYVGSKGSFFTLPDTDRKADISFEFGTGFYPLAVAWTDPELPASAIRSVNDTIYFGVRTSRFSPLGNNQDNRENWLRQNPDGARYYRNMPVFFTPGANHPEGKINAYSSVIGSSLFLFPLPTDAAEKTFEWIISEIKKSDEKFVFIFSPRSLSAATDQSREWASFMKTLNKSGRQIVLFSEASDQTTYLKFLSRIREVSARTENAGSENTINQIITQSEKKKFRGIKYQVLWSSDSLAYCSTEVKSNQRQLNLSFRASANGSLIKSFQAAD
ncbi:MAG: sulfatase-like hydrolase/transferase [Bacteroidia bacterium]